MNKIAQNMLKNKSDKFNSLSDDQDQFSLVKYHQMLVMILEK